MLYLLRYGRRENGRGVGLGLHTKGHIMATDSTNAKSYEFTTEHQARLFRAGVGSLAGVDASKERRRTTSMTVGAHVWMVDIVFERPEYSGFSEARTRAYCDGLAQGCMAAAQARRAVPELASGWTLSGAMGKIRHALNEADAYSEAMREFGRGSSDFGDKNTGAGSDAWVAVTDIEAALSFYLGDGAGDATGDSIHEGYNYTTQQWVDSPNTAAACEEPDETHEMKRERIRARGERTPVQAAYDSAYKYGGARRY